MNFFDYLRGLFQKRYFTGLIDDPRTQAEKDRDFDIEETVGGPAADPFGNERITKSSYPEEDQQDTYSCVPHAVGGALAILRLVVVGTYVRLSWIFAYRLRANYPNQGCWLQNIFDVYAKNGAPLYSTLPDPATEAEANAVVITPQMRYEAEIFKGLEYYTFKSSYNDIEMIAAVAQTGAAVPIIFYSTYKEWARSEPALLSSTVTRENAGVRHCVKVLPKSGHIRNGKRYVTVQDSAHFGGITLRHLSEDFIRARVYDAAAWRKVNILSSGPRPKHTFTKSLKLGMRSEEVRQMQLLLISLGLLPTDCATGLFGGRTLAGVHAFQNMFAGEILVPLKLDAPTDNFGSMSIAKANKLCSG